MFLVIMRKRNFNKKLGWVEAGFYLGGVTLLVVFFQLRSESTRQAEEGLEAFEKVMSQRVLVQDQATGEGLLTAVVSPNQELWAEKRIEEYRESIQVAADPPLAVMKIENLGIHVPIYNGTDEFNLNRGVGRIKGTARLDEPGNLGIAGHRDGFFRSLKDIEIGETIEIQTTRGTISYSVSSITIVDPSDISVLAETADPTITLVTCYPFYYVGHAPKRYIVKATAKHFLASN